MKNKFVLDASALLVLINTETGHEKMMEYIPEACISAVNLSETISVLHSISMPNDEIKSILNSLVHTIIPFDEQHAYQTAQLRSITKNKGLSLGDHACLALARMKNLSVVTADKIWSTLDIGVKVILISCWR